MNPSDRVITERLQPLILRSDAFSHVFFQHAFLACPLDVCLHGGHALDCKSQTSMSRQHLLFPDNLHHPFHPKPLLVTNPKRSAKIESP
jgi:hypothetical protein